MGVSLKMCLSILLKEKRVDWKDAKSSPLKYTFKKILSMYTVQYLDQDPEGKRIRLRIRNTVYNH